MADGTTRRVRRGTLQDYARALHAVRTADPPHGPARDLEARCLRTADIHHDDGQRSYSDSFDDRSGTLAYSYRGTDPLHRDNVGLRRAWRERVPLVYFHAVEPGAYVAAYPVFVVNDNPAALVFTMQVDDLTASMAAARGYPVADDATEARRAYVTRTVRQRLHQVAFRERVIRAYQERCALCSLRHVELLDAAHITPDSDPGGERSSATESLSASCTTRPLIGCSSPFVPTT